MSWDLEVYDAHRPVYTQQGIRNPSHALATPLAPCGHYRWSVRPAYEVGDGIRYGAWMRRPVTGEESPIDGLSGRDAAAAPAYTQDFAELEISCKAK